MELKSSPVLAIAIASGIHVIVEPGAVLFSL